MKNKKNLISVLLVMLLVVCLLPMSALAAPTEQSPSPSPSAAVESPEPEKDEDEPLEDDELEAVFVEADEELYADEKQLVYNNGGLVYSNGATVYNNGGIVYNNGGTVYNNNGTVYSNGGTVYNNTGSVFNNGAEVFTHDGDVSDSHVYGYFSFSLAEDYSELVIIDGLDEQEDGELLISQDAVCSISANEGYTIVDAQADAGKITAEEDGTYSLSEVDANVSLTLTIKLDAPSMSLEAGTYAKAQKLELSAAQGSEIYYTTDGTEPQATSEKYSSAISIEEGMQVKAVAIATGAEMSELAEASYSIVKLTAPSFDSVDEDYSRPAAAGIKLENLGSVAAKVESVEISGKDADSFKLSRSTGKTIAAEATDEKTWTIQPLADLEKGSYSATVTFTFDSGDSTELKISFRVK